MTTINSNTSFSSPALVMEDGADTISQVIVHPLVLLHVLDHHTRRQEGSGRVIGTLLGRRDGKKVCWNLKQNDLFLFQFVMHVSFTLSFFVLQWALFSVTLD